MNVIQIIEKKKHNKKLTDEEIRFMVEEYTNGNIEEYQMSAFLMAISIFGLRHKETFYLTKAMLNSGSKLDLSKINGLTADKHSTGGVGDKTTLVLVPMLAACGLKMAKLSGRGLGHTGGTIDKLESIPGYKTSLDENKFIEQVDKIGLAIAGQSAKIAPADKKIYALRDVTANVDSIPLIASSVMSKKLAISTDFILLDVTVGSGAFMKTYRGAKELAKIMVSIGKQFGRNVHAIITNMDEPLGNAVGNSLEVIESINTLHNQGPKDLTKLCLESASHLLVQSKICSTRTQGLALAKESLKSGKAFDYFVKMVEAQGGDTKCIKDPRLFKKAKYEYVIESNKKGYIKKIKSYGVGFLSMRLGAGRETLDDNIDMSAGIVFHKKVGDKINVGEPLCTIYTNKENYKHYESYFDSIIQISRFRVIKKRLIKKVITR